MYHSQYNWLPDFIASDSVINLSQTSLLSFTTSQFLLQIVRLLSFLIEISSIFRSKRLHHFVFYTYVKLTSRISPSLIPAQTVYCVEKTTIQWVKMPFQCFNYITKKAEHVFLPPNLFKTQCWTQVSCLKSFIASGMKSKIHGMTLNTFYYLVHKYFPKFYLFNIMFLPKY